MQTLEREVQGLKDKLAKLQEAAKEDRARARCSEVSVQRHARLSPVQLAVVRTYNLHFEHWERLRIACLHVSGFY